ncbi:MAG: (deoxy)nucleoside triphosphate pyrophosphohydrolase [Myxococcota bacterium]
MTTETSPPESDRALRRVVVAAGLVTAADGRVLIAQRRPGGPLSLKWEFPGGKIESGESPVAALQRELREELGIAIRVGRIWDVLHHIYTATATAPAIEVIMLVYHCQMCPDEQAKCLEVNDIAWCQPKEIAAYDMLSADLPLIERLVAEGVPPPLTSS